jgi:hypothetical protein
MPDVPEQITINGREYDPEDAAQLIELGSKWRKTETELNTPLDKVYPEFTKSRQELKEAREQLAERDQRLEEFTKQQEAAKVKAETPEDIQNARKAARELGLLDEDVLKEKGYMTRDQMKEFLAQEQTQRQLVEGVEKQGKQLEGEIDGSDGRVPFVYKAVLPYAATYKIDDLKEAYEQMNERANARWKEAQIEKENKGGLSTLQGGGGKKEPQRPKYTNDNIGAALGEWLDSIQS